MLWGFVKGTTRKNDAQRIAVCMSSKMPSQSRWHRGPCVTIPRCGKSKALYAVAEHWTGMGVVAMCCARALTRFFPLQEVRPSRKTRNEFYVKLLALITAPATFGHSE